jgi:acetyltransferase-like isoleucine patch superfamily enzyme
MKKLKRLLRAVLLFLLPAILLRHLAPLLGIRLGKGVSIGFSFVDAERLVLEEGARIGHLNFIRLKSVYLSKEAYIGTGNRIHAQTLDLFIHPKGAIGNENWIHRASSPVTYGAAVLEIGHTSKITFRHHVDCTCSVKIGHYSTLAGVGSQIWTHGYFHAEEGVERIRVDGEVLIGNNVNISSACVINAGVTIADAITVGSNVCISKSLSEKGMYVSQGLRYIPKQIDDIRKAYHRVEEYPLVEEVYLKLKSEKGSHNGTQGQQV